MRVYDLFKVVLFINVLLLKRVSGNNDMMDSLQNRLPLEVMKIMPQTSVVVSTLALRFSLGKLASVAEGDAKQELMKVLGYKSMEMVTNCHKQLKSNMDAIRQFSLLMVNKIYVNYSKDIKPDFFKNSSDEYGATVEQVGFQYPNSARSYINRWVETTTFRRITDMLNDGDIDTATTMLLISALHFKPSWEFPFNFKKTSTQKFNFYNSSFNKIPMMSKTDHFAYLDHAGCKIFKLHLATEGSFVMFAVPHSAQGLPGLIDQLYKEPDLIRKIMRNMDFRVFTLHIPLFKIKTYVDYTGFLQEIGLDAIFSESSGLNSILEANSEVKNIRLNKAKQKVFVEFDEMGTFRTTSNPRPQVEDRIPKSMIREMIIDCPFYFTVNIQTDQQTVHELFNGVYYGPDMGLPDIDSTAGSLSLLYVPAGPKINYCAGLAAIFKPAIKFGDYCTSYRIEGSKPSELVHYCISELYAL